MSMMEWIRFNLITPLVDQLFPAAIHVHAALTIEVILKIAVIITPVLFTVAYLTYAERKVIGFIQGRIRLIGWVSLVSPYGGLDNRLPMPLN